MDFQQLLVPICTVIIAVCTAGNWVYRLFRPVANADKELKTLAGDVPMIKASVKDLTARVGKIELHQDSDIRTLRDHSEANRAICSALLALLDHELTGDHTAELESAKASLTTYLINR